MIYISKLFSPISTGTLAGDIDVGATVKINENGQPEDYLVVHQGLPGDMYDASCEGTWLLRKDIARDMAWNSEDVNDYANSDINAYLNGDWLNIYDSDVAEQIVQCKIPYLKGRGNTGYISSGSDGLSVKAFLLGGYEVGWTSSTNPYFPIDGEKLSFFDSGSGTSASNKRIAKFNGSFYIWHLRSAATNAINSTWRSSASGTNQSLICTYSSGLRPSLILPYSFKFKEVS